ncbi:transmembrane protein, putative (macronuclear) [Tetrahymena thermophila SB210]|uniref:Transmembrane protein, putative n=1 Tax=Tetrahymena thermophila (strain SB210) TaxID=312017 RepID=I7LWW6_TETTS|nr:transmembrane protein, putative [Tetrahymena thermophila SB210]EAS02990.2 transmembrane protein, putative [Tetrahymena thermophila SB210]|eukprot:XP_001023235.2 transmembrane protein, putative [Tetrahymena thermophila SB210]
MKTPKKLKNKYITKFKKTFKDLHKIKRFLFRFLGCLLLPLLFISILITDYLNIYLLESERQWQSYEIQAKNFTDSVNDQLNLNHIINEKQNQFILENNLNQEKGLQLNYMYYYQILNDQLQNCQSQKEELIYALQDYFYDKNSDLQKGYTFEVDQKLRNIASYSKIRKQHQYTTFVYGVQTKKFQSVFLFNEQEEFYKNIDFILSDQDWKRQYIKLNGNKVQIHIDFQEDYVIRAIGIQNLISDYSDGCEINKLKIISVAKNINKIVNANEDELRDLSEVYSLSDRHYYKVDEQVIETYYFQIDEFLLDQLSSGLKLELENSGNSQYTCIFKIKILV